MAARSEKITFMGSQGFPLAARLDYPHGEQKATALFAHCFTCSKDVFAASRIAGELADRGFAVLRFDFTGLGMSGGEFANTNFSSNVQDIVAAAAHLRTANMPVSVLIGHSLGGAAVLAAAGEIPEAKAVATINAPADAGHVVQNFAAHLADIRENGEAPVTLAGRQFTIKKQFLDDLDAVRLSEKIGDMRKALIVFHSPADAVVGLDNASAIFLAAKHPKSFISLPDADHLLSSHDDAVYVAEVLSAWASRYVMASNKPAMDVLPEGVVQVAETRRSKFQNEARTGRHTLTADEPQTAGGGDTGPSPYDYLSIALAACTSMTMRLYADFKKLPVDKITVQVRHGKGHLADCHDCVDDKSTAQVDYFERQISIVGDLTDEMRSKLLEIANKCPVHNTLERGSRVRTKM